MNGGDEEDAQLTRDWGKSVDPARMDLQWTEQLGGSLQYGRRVSDAK